MLAIKSSLIYEAYYKLSKSFYLPFFIPLGLMNLVEFTAYFESTQSLLGLKLYYLCALASICGALYIALKITESNFFVFTGYVFATNLVAAAFLFSDMIIQDYVPFLLTMTAVRGEHYYLWQAMALVGLLAILTVLIDGMRRHRTRKIKANSAAFLLAILAPFSLGVLAIILMAMGVKMNAAIWLPISTTISMLLARLLITENYTLDIRYLFRKDVQKAIKRLFVSTTEQENGLKEDLREYEKVLVNGALQDNEHDLKSTAKQLNISETSIRRKKNEFAS